MAADRRQHPEVEEHTAESQGLALQELGGAGIPSVAIGAAAPDQADDQDRERNVGQDHEDDGFGVHPLPPTIGRGRSPSFVLSLIHI